MSWIMNAPPGDDTSGLQGSSGRNAVAGRSPLIAPDPSATADGSDNACSSVRYTGITVSTAPRLAKLPAVQKALLRLSSYEDWITDRQVEFCSIPAPSFEEQPRAEYFRRQFTRLKLDEVHIDAEGNVLAEIPGTAAKRDRRIVALTAHLDTVFPRTTTVAIRRERGRL